MFEFIETHWIFDEYRKAFPHSMPSLFAQEQMLVRIANREVWAEVVMMWALNQYRPDSIGKMIDCYEEKIAKQKSTSHVRNQPTQREAIEAELKAIEAMGIQ